MNFKNIFAISIIPILLLASFSIVSAKNVALAVADVNSLNPVHEQPIYDILTSMGETVTLVDQNSVNVDWSSFNLLVVAGRAPKSSPLPSAFAANLPVNTVPTIAIDFFNLYNWGWIASGGVNDMQSGSAQSVYIVFNNHPLTTGYTANQRVFVLNQSGYDAVDIMQGTSNFTAVAYLDAMNDAGIAFAAPNTQLVGGKSIASNSAAIFFGINYPAFWTQDAVNLFENAVNWITNLNYTPPTSPTLSGPSQAISQSALYAWTAANGANGVQNYEVQVSTTQSFSQITADVQTSGQTYTLNSMMDGQRYYVRVRAIDFLNLRSPWSNVISTIADFTPIILTITSPTSGTVLNLGDTFFVNVLINAPRVQAGSVCTIAIDVNVIDTLPFNQSTSSCSGNVIVPQSLAPGPSLTSLVVSATDEFGATNSTSVPIIIQNRPISSSTTSTTTTTTSTSTSSQSNGNTGSSGSSGYYALLNINTPRNLSYYTNSQNTFAITAKNAGDMVLHYVKVTIASNPVLTVSINPDATFDLNPGESKTYYISVQSPTMEGTYDVFVKSLSMETSETTRTIPVIVGEKPIVVDFGISSIEIPDFVAGTTSLTNITIVNKGNVVGTASVQLDLPEGWIASSSTASVDILPNQEAKLSFEVTPSVSSGTLTFSGNFTGSNETQSFSYPVPVTAKSSSDILAAITGALASSVGNPIIAIPIAIAIAVIIAFYYKTKTSDFTVDYKMPKTAKASYGKVTPQSNQKNNFKTKKTNPSAKSNNNAYEKWEKSSRRS